MKQLCILTLLLTSSLSFAQNLIFSLDDNPDSPICGPVVGGYFSAECPFGGCIGSFGASPSLGCSSDVFIPGPAFVGNLAPHSYVDSFSSNHAGLGNGALVHMEFSVDRYTSGVAGSGVRAQFSRKQAPADIFESSQPFARPGTFVGMLGGGCFGGILASAGTGVSNTLIRNQNTIGLRPLLGPAVFTAGTAINAAGVSNKDNIDAMDSNFDNSPLLYYTGAPADALVMGYSAAQIMMQNLGGPTALWATPTQIGLDCNPDGEYHDSIDALIVFDYDQQAPNQVQPGIDFAVFSLSPGSPTLASLNAMGVPVDPATIFFTTFQGSFGVYLWSTDLGLLAPAGTPLTTVNIDALELRYSD